jgi:hypothetical protein
MRCWAGFQHVRSINPKPQSQVLNEQSQSVLYPAYRDL